MAGGKGEGARSWEWDRGSGKHLGKRLATRATTVRVCDGLREAKQRLGGRWAGSKGVVTQSHNVLRPRFALRPPFGFLNSSSMSLELLPRRPPPPPPALPPLAIPPRPVLYLVGLPLEDAELGRADVLGGCHRRFDRTDHRRAVVDGARLSVLPLDHQHVRALSHGQRRRRAKRGARQPVARVSLNRARKVRVDNRVHEVGRDGGAGQSGEALEPDAALGEEAGGDERVEVAARDGAVGHEDRHVVGQRGVEHQQLRQLLRNEVADGWEEVHAITRNGREGVERRGCGCGCADVDVWVCGAGLGVLCMGCVWGVSPYVQVAHWEW
eukprot:4057837-Pleurochrysis_carterae.AAC.7